MLARHILVVEDDRDIADLIAYNLKKAGFDVSVAVTGREAIASISARRPDLILLDVMLPELSGTEVAIRLRSSPATAAIPIIMLTAKSAEADQLAGLTAGADDYITKPFSPKVLTARIEAVLRRASAVADSDARVLSLGPVRIDTETHEVQVNSTPCRLTLTEFRLLAALLQANGRVLNRTVLTERAMGPGVTVTERTIDVHMTAIRRKLGDASSLIRTVRGVGYRAAIDDDAEIDAPANA